MTLRKNFLLVGMIVVSTGLAGITSADHYPGREDPRYQDVPYIEMETLYQHFLKDKILIVDVRSHLEYETIHAEGAHHIALASSSFEAELRILAKTYPETPLSFYCNGTTCLKSYEAQIRATDAGIENTYAFDAGIPAWAERYPEHTILLERPLSESTVQWISDEEFHRKCVSWEEFQQLAVQENTRVIDARDNVQKGAVDPAVKGQLNSDEERMLEEFSHKNEAMLAMLGDTSPVIAQPMDQLIKRVVSKELFKDQTLLIFDQVGKQVRWLMYHLEAAGYTRYYFLSGGAYDVIGIQAYRE